MDDLARLAAVAARVLNGDCDGDKGDRLNLSGDGRYPAKAMCRKCFTNFKVTFAKTARVRLNVVENPVLIFYFPRPSLFYVPTQSNFTRGELNSAGCMTS